MTAKANDCVTHYESKAKVYPPSEPQLFLGLSVERLSTF